MPRITKSTTKLLLEGGDADSIVSAFPAGAIVVFDQDLRYVRAGGEGLTSVGLTQEMIEGKLIHQVFPREVATVLETQYRLTLAGESASMEIEFGGRIFTHRLAPLIDEEGITIGGIGFAFDVTEARQSERALRGSEERLREERARLAEAESIGHSGSWEWDLVTGAILWSEGLFRLHGMAPMTFDAGYTQAAARVHPDDRPLVDAAMDACRQSEETVQFRYRVERVGDGELRWFDSRATGVFVDGVAIRMAGAVVDVTEKVRTEIEKIQVEAELLAANNFQQAIIAASPDFMFIVNVTTATVIYGSRNRNVLGLTIDETMALGDGARGVMVHPQDQALLAETDAKARSLDDGQVLDIRYRGRHVDGTWRWLSRRVTAFRRDSSGRVVEVLGVLRDITDLVHAEEQLTHDAVHDSLTGLPNRTLLLERLDAALARSTVEGRDIAVIFCDLDGFKLVNDVAGHAAGDAVLVETARRLRDIVREGDTIARVGGDEFVLVIEPWNRLARNEAHPAESAHQDHKDRSGAFAVADRIVRALRTPIQAFGVEFGVTMSVGIAYASSSKPLGSPHLTASDIVQQADAAMYRAKREGKDHVEVYEVAWPTRRPLIDR